MKILLTVILHDLICHTAKSIYLKGDSNPTPYFQDSNLDIGARLFSASVLPIRPFVISQS